MGYGFKDVHVKENEQCASFSYLVCPNCLGDNLHHVAVRIYGRHEDADTCLKTTVGTNNWDPGYAQTTLTQGTENPSDRRVGLTIDFTCEHCSGSEVVAQLCVSQNKGSTNMFWRWPD